MCEHTDESEANSRFGADIYRSKTNYEESILMSEATVFQTEILAILKCIKFLLNKRSRYSTYIYSNSRAAIEALSIIQLLQNHL